MTNIKRYRLYNYSDCIWEDDDGEVVWYDDHLAIVEKLKQELQEQLEDAYNKGWDEGHSAGWCEAGEVYELK